MLENVSQIMSDNEFGDAFLSQDDIEEEIEIIESEEIDGIQESDEELNEQLMASNERPVIDDSILVFKGHEKAVLCCDLNSNNTLGVSGSQDDMAFVWKTENANILFECKGHKDSVICAKFNHSDSYIATADMNGLIQVWNIGGEKVFDYEIDEINWLLWHPIVNNVLLSGTTKGDAWMWKINDHNTLSSHNTCKTFQTFGSSNSVAKCMNDGKRIVMGYENGIIRIWDLKTTTVLNTISEFNAHKGSVTSIDCTSDDALIGSGSVDSTAKLINSQNGKVIATFQCGQSSVNEEEDDSVESVSFSSFQSLFATATVNGSIEIWDISTQTRRHICQQSAGISKLLWDQNNPYLLYTAGLDGVLRIYDGRSGQLLNTKNGHNDHILDFTISSNSSFVLTASEDSTCRIFSLS